MSINTSMRVAVAGGTGTVGRYVTEAPRSAGRYTVVISRSAGVDLLTGAGLPGALDGADLVPMGHYAGKLRQEELIKAGPVPWTVLRATQFHEFPAQILDRIKGPIVPVPAAPSATVAGRVRAGQDGLRSSGWPAARRGHWAVGRPSVRNWSPWTPNGWGQPEGESSQVSCRP
jgi:uncharacterized protein YbjT (DUF2867 family)